MSNKKDKILELLNITNRINNNEFGLDMKYNILLQEINELFIDNSPLLTPPADRTEVIKQNKEIYGHKNTGYKDSKGIYQHEVKSTALIDSSVILNKESIYFIRLTKELYTREPDKIKDIYITIKNVIEAMIYFKSKDYVVSVLNFANADSCCGHVESAQIAQEEELCRSSPMLYNSLQLFSNSKLGDGRERSTYEYDSKFEWGSKNWDKRILITPNVIFRRNDSKNKYDKLEKPFVANVISAAAPNLSGTIFNKNDIELKEKLQRVIEHIYYAIEYSFYNLTNNSHSFIDEAIKMTWRSMSWWHSMNWTTENYITESKMSSDIFPLKERKRVLLLGPWGCGMFAPANKVEYYEFMAKQFCEVLERSNKIYDIVCFTFLQKDEIYDKFYEVIKKKFNIIKEDYV